MRSSPGLVTVSEQPAVTERDGDGDADVVLEGTAVALYLALWNRSDEVTADGSATSLAYRS